MWGKPSIPPITDEKGVIQWFFKYDDSTACFRDDKSHWPETIQDDILKALNKYPDADSFREYVKWRQEQWDTSIAQEWINIQATRGPLSRKEEHYYKKLLSRLHGEGINAASLKILKYFLEIKYGIKLEPPTPESPS